VDLVGGVSSGEAAFQDAESVTRRRHQQNDEFASAVETMADGNTDNWAPLLGSSVVREAMSESAKVQMHASLGEDAEAETPLFDGGLIPSADSLSWVRA
jgi:halogenation protein CepH